MLVSVEDELDLAGQTIGPYEIIAKIGAGGMGSVWRAKQRSLEREVAIKVIDRKLVRDVDTIKRFVREGKLASKLSHPNIVAIHELGQTPDGVLYLAMELVAGRTLHAVIADGALPIARIQRIGTQLVDALEVAHAQSIVHRDLKPDNIMVLGDQVKILDFGLARSFVDPSTRATATGVIAGTPRYLPPEVGLEGAPPAPAQDLYALGVILGEMAMGGPLWNAPTLESMFAQKLHAPPAMDGVDPALRTLIEQLLVAAPGARPDHTEIRLALAALDPTARPPLLSVDPSVQAAPLTSSAFAPPRKPELGLELEREWLDEKAARQAPRPPPPRRWGLIIGAIAGVLLVAAGAVAVVTVARQKRATEKVERHVPGAAGTVEIDIRSIPPAPIAIDGRPMGKTPLTLQLPRGSKPVVIEATMDGKTQAVSAVPDHDQVIRFPQ